MRKGRELAFEWRFGKGSAIRFLIDIYSIILFGIDRAMAKKADNS